MNRLKIHSSILQLLHKAKPSLRKAIIANGNKQLICCTCDCTLNVLHRLVPISQQQKNRFSKHKQSLRTLVD